MKYYIIAGEASGDLHGHNLMRALRQADPRSEFRFWGGDLMQSIEDNLVTHYRDMAFMGFVEVVKHLPTILGFFKKAKADILAYQPDRVILIDYPGFNLRMAKWLHQQGIATTYYITPQVWAWHSSRVKQLAQFTDQRLVILPFEPDFFASRGVHVDYVGHPLLDAIDQWSPQPDFATRHGIGPSPIAILPGSRRQEITKLLPTMLAAAAPLGRDLLIAKAPSQPLELYAIAQDYPQAKVIENATYDILHTAHAALVASGTATLETALHGIPQIVCYRSSPVSYAIGKRLVDLDYISLVNLIMDRSVVPELLQGDCEAHQVGQALQAILHGPSRETMIADYKELRKKLMGGASERAAQMIAEISKGKE